MEWCNVVVVLKMIQGHKNAVKEAAKDGTNKKGPNFFAAIQLQIRMG